LELDPTWCGFQRHAFVDMQKMHLKGESSEIAAGCSTRTSDSWHNTCAGTAQRQNMMNDLKIVHQQTFWLSFDLLLPSISHD